MPNEQRSYTFTDSRSAVSAPTLDPDEGLAAPADLQRQTLKQQLQFHLSLLKSKGIEDLPRLGGMRIRGNAIADAGLTTPGTIAAGQPETRLFSHAYRKDAAQASFLKIAGSGTVLRSERLAQPTAERARPGGVPVTDHLLNLCFLAAEWITIENDANLILAQPYLYLVILTKKLTVGTNVTLTYERMAVAPPLTPAKPPKPASPTPPAPYSQGLRGVNGASGQRGGTGASFLRNPAPQVELWTLDMNGTIAVDLRGQDGGSGGRGGDGGDGGNGGEGSPAQGNDFWCNHGPGPGGNGGNGGRAGDSGPGGDGGPGGRFALFAPQPVINAFASGFFVSVDGGQGGPGGIPGTPGAAGNGGPVGFHGPKGCTKAGAGKTPGSSGSQGATGSQGPGGQPGPKFLDAIKFLPIDASDFTTALLKPAIISVNPKFAKEGMSVTLTGQNFTSTDTVKALEDSMAWIACPTSVFSNVGATFQVVKLPGGPREIVLEQTDQTRSNLASVYIQPTLSGIENGPRVRPGSTVKIFGTGFDHAMRIFINKQDVGGATFLDPHTIEATIVRPVSGVTPNPAGEEVDFHVSLPDHTASNSIQLVLDTYRIFGFGDSVVWGTGLSESEKFHALVENEVRARNGAIGVYKTVAAHTGAIIGAGVSQTGSEKNGEVPSDYLTIHQQVDKYAGIPDAAHVDLVLLDGGINDVGLRTIFHWEKPEAVLRGLIQQHCRNAMTDLLVKVGTKFTGARIIVTGYYAPLNEGSDDKGVERFLIAILAAFGFEAIVTNPPERDRVKQRCVTFVQDANDALAKAVQDANAKIGGTPRIAFADPAFGPTNSAFGSDPWVFGVGIDLAPEDAMRAERKEFCDWQADSGTKTFCLRASMGHPNSKGAMRYASKIFPLL
jgi:hypothetical protein